MSENVYHYSLNRSYERRSYERILYELSSIIYEYDGLENLICDRDEPFEKDFICSDREKFRQIKESIENRKKQCEKEMQLLCDHEFVNDLIDIDPDNSRMIRYCSKCNCMPMMLESDSSIEDELLDREREQEELDSLAEQGETWNG
jgi:hypothetical protein